jgi:DHA2 family multidrug resistance protein
MFTSETPFIAPGLFRDRNFAVGSVVAVLLGVLVFAAMPLIGIMLQQLLGYPVLLAGLVQAPRGVATAITMMVVGGLVGKVDTRLLLFAGLAFTGLGYMQMAAFSLDTSEADVILSGITLSIGSGLIFVPLSTIVFSTLNPKLRNEGAATFTLVRNIGQAVGISLLQVMTLRNGATVQARLSEGVRPDSPPFGLYLPDFDFLSPDTMAGMYHEAARQAMMVAYVDSFWALYVLSIVLVPIVFMMRPVKRDPRGAHG